MKKYELTESHGTLWRIRALRYIPRYGVKPGDLGGWVESENNLSQEGNCWVEENAKVSGDARVYGNAKVSGDVWVYGNAQVSGDAWVYGNVMVSGDARVYGNAMVSGDARVSGYATVCDDASVYGNAWVEERARASGKARICADAVVYGNAQVSGDAWVYGDAHISQNAFVNSAQDLLTVGPIGSRKACTTFYRAVGGIWVCCGCFNGSVEDFETAVKEKHGNSQNARVYLKAIELAKVQITAI